MTADTHPSWDDLPLKYGEDGEQYQSLYARYSHVGCPGHDYEDNCAAPWDCATKGRCRANYERTKHAYPVNTHSRKNLLDVEVMYETRLG